MSVAPDALDVVRHPRARRARLAVDPATGRARLTLPPRAALRPALAWAQTQTAWVSAQRARLPAPRPFADGATLPFDDRLLTIAWKPNASRVVRRDGDWLVTGGPADTLGRRIEGWLRRAALALLSEDTAEIAARAGVAVTRVQIGDPRSRWGSCAVGGSIRYSWRLAMAPRLVRRATVAHEVAHRVHMNHGAAFHALVRILADREEDVAASAAWLRSHGAGLHWLGRSPG